MNKPETVYFYRTNLPHWEVLDGRYFVTMRVKNSLPRNVIRSLFVEQKKAEDTNHSILPQQ